MKVSANLGFLYTNFSISERIASAGEDGFEAVEFHWPYDVTPQELRVAMAAAGVSGLSLNTRRGNLEAGEFGLAALPGRENEARAAIMEAVEYAAASGLATVHVMAGRAEGPAAEAAFVENLKFACDRAAVHRIGILIEPLNLRDVPGYFLTGTDHARRVIASAGRSNLRILYDVYHMQIMQGDHVRTLEGLGDTVGHVQIAAVPDRTEPDRGEVDMHWLLERISYSGFVGAEYRPTREPRDWLRRFKNSGEVS